MKNPNGYGCVFKLTGKRRKPWGVRVTTGWDDNGKQLYRNIGYYVEQADALIALAEFNKNPYGIEVSTITFDEVYTNWSDKKYKKISDSNANGYKASYKCCADLYTIPFVNIRTPHMQDIVDTCGKNYPTLRKLKVLFNQLFEYAMENDIVVKDYSEFIDIIQYKDKNPNKIDREPFTNAEVKKLWDSVDSNEYVQIVLMLIYSGVRISELLDLKKEDIYLKERYFDVIDSKTPDGIRKVPIAAKVLKFYEHWMTKDCDYLLCTPDNQHFMYRNYFDSYWTTLLTEMKMETHKPHDTRHTCTTMLAVANANQTIIKLIIGHSGAMSLNEKVYTHFPISKLVGAIDLI
ncbi:MAG: tyrosine-type recombinase/integrase [Candidatus Cloacimonetes bacterium]|nr:tyrosine-type recombinase/integrase [Candidatus Cloacimonadota bacterium]